MLFLEIFETLANSMLTFRMLTSYLPDKRYTQKNSPSFVHKIFIPFTSITSFLCPNYCSFHVPFVRKRFKNSSNLIFLLSVCFLVSYQRQEKTDTPCKMPIYGSTPNTTLEVIILPIDKHKRFPVMLNNGT